MVTGRAMARMNIFASCHRQQNRSGRAQWGGLWGEKTTGSLAQRPRPAYPQPSLPLVGCVMELHLPEGYAVNHAVFLLFPDLLRGALQRRETSRESFP